MRCLCPDIDNLQKKNGCRFNKISIHFIIFVFLDKAEEQSTTWKKAKAEIKFGMLLAFQFIFR